MIALRADGCDTDVVRAGRVKQMTIPRWLKAAIMAATVLLGAQPALSASRLRAEIVWTEYGVPHVRAQTFAGLGYGQGYAFAKDNLCLLADHFVTLRGERTKVFGAEGFAQVAFAKIPNVESDAFFHAAIDAQALHSAAKLFSKDYADLVQGYIAGYNRYLRDTPPDRRPVACRNAAWVTPATLDDFLRLNEEKMLQGGAGRWIRQMLAAAPPSSTAEKVAQLPVDLGDHFELGSNAWAFGKSAAADGRALLVGNPHFPWETTNRFYESHLTLPGRLDVMGASLFGVPGVAVGFNKDVAWSHTVSTDRHFTLFELTLDPRDPTAYLFEGKSYRMDRRTVSVQTNTGQPVLRTLYWTRFGPVVVSPQAGLNWTTKVAYAVKDANDLNTLSGNAWMAIGQARTIDDVRAAIDKDAAIPWVNTIAADRFGKVMYADVTSTPNVDLELLKSCAPKSGIGILGAIARLYVLDGSRSECEWRVDVRSTRPGLAPPASMPHVVREDYVANSNDSYWLANPRSPLTGFSPVIGATDVAQNLRTRAGVLEIENALQSGGKVTPLLAETMLLRNRNLAAELFLDDVLSMCRAAPAVAASTGESVDLSKPCAVLAAWDRRMDLDSRGAHLFNEFWKLTDKIKLSYRVPFDRMDPIHTPRGLVTDSQAAKPILTALADAVVLINKRGIALDARWGDLAVAKRGEVRVPLHGGEGGQGVLNAHQSEWTDGVGYLTNSGSSYIQIVRFDEQGPVVDAVLTYSQATDPASPHATDQTRLYSQKRWIRLPFHWPDIEAAKGKTRLMIEE